MKKLSELSMDTYITVESNSSGDAEVMTKADFLESSYFLDYPVEKFPKITVAEKTCVKFDLFDAVEHLGFDETHERWLEDVCYDITKSDIDVKLLESKMNEIFKNNPTYWDGEPVDIDMTR